MNLAYRLTFVLLLLLAGCAQLGLPTVQTLDQKIAVAYGTVTTVRATSTALLQAKKLTPDDDSNIQAGADNARAGIEVARKLSGTDLTAAGNRLSAVSTALQALQTYLATKQGK